MKRCLACGHIFDHQSWTCPECGRAPEVRDGFLSFAPELAGTEDMFQHSDFAALAQIEAGSFWFRSRNQLILWALRTYFPDAIRFLEVGCGTGFVLASIIKTMPAIASAGSEIYFQGLKIARQRAPEATLLQMDARNMPFWSEFDVIGAFDVLEHVADDRAVLRQVFQAVKPGGGVILTVPQHPFLWSNVDEYSCHKRRYTRGDLSGKMLEAGFRIERATSFVTLLLPFMVAVRMNKKKPKAEKVVRNELMLGSRLDRLLETAMCVERLCIRWGLSLPCGGSLLMVAKRS